MLKEKRCVICKTIFHIETTNHNDLRKNTCSSKCRQLRKHQTDRRRYDQLSKRKKLQDAIDYVTNHGYTVIPVTSNGYRIVMEPIQNAS